MKIVLDHEELREILVKEFENRIPDEWKAPSHWLEIKYDEKTERLCVIATCFRKDGVI